MNIKTNTLTIHALYFMSKSKKTKNKIKI